MKANPTPALTPWQSKQAAMLYYITSLEYLQNLHRLVSDFIDGVVDPLLDIAKLQGRDAYLTDERWGTRRTSENWANNAWPVLKDLQISIAKRIAERGNDEYLRPGVSECLRGVEQFSLEWTTPDEEEVFDLALEAISTVGGWLDDTLAHEELSKWNDFNISYHYSAFAAMKPTIARYGVRMDVSAETGQVPPVTGVYVALDDPDATLQFAFAEHHGRELREANTFNDIGLAALNFVGRDALWLDHQKMFEFATSKKYASRFHDELFLEGELQPTLARVAVKRAALKTRRAKWYLVEALPGEFESASSTELVRTAPETSHRIIGGEKCAVEGYYFTPAVSGSRRYFTAGEATPNFEAKYGQTFWQWDGNQE